MRLGSGIRATLFALAVALVGLTSAARADSGTISFRVLKGGWFIGASGGSGTLFFRGRAYPVTIGGLSAGFVVRRVADVYGAAGPGAALGVGGQAIVLTHEKGAVLSLTGQQIGLQINADLSGLAISMR
jgi:hypothetical protein